MIKQQTDNNEPLEINVSEQVKVKDSAKVRIEPRTLKGFPDYPPQEQIARQRMFAVIQGVFERFGFLPLSTPALEYKDVLMGKYGDEERLVYDFVDKGGRDVALRYDLTVPLARFVAQNQGKLAMPFKRYQIAPVWRAENTQKGRLREFYQCDIDVVGTQSPLADAEAMACLCQVLEALGAANYELRVNDRSVLSIFSVETIRVIDKIDKIRIDGVIKQLAEINRPAAEIEQVKNLLRPDNQPEPPANIKKIIDLVAAQGIPEKNIIFDPSIARALDYYTGAVFEIKLKDKPEFGSIVGGGRYDNLVDQFSDKSLPAVGGSIGIDRLLAAMGEMGLMKAGSVVRVLVVNQDAALEKDYLALIFELRGNNINAELYYEPAKLEKQFKYAAGKGIEYALIMGAAERERGTVQLKDLASREQKEVIRADIINLLK